MANTKSTFITNADATPLVRTPRYLTRGPVFSAEATVEVAAADVDGSTYRFIRLPSNAKIISILLSNDAITAGTDYDIGIYKTAAAGGAVVLVNAFADALDLSSAAKNVNVTYEQLGIENVEKRLWEVAGLTSDPALEYDIVATGVTVGTAAGTISMTVFYTV